MSKENSSESAVKPVMSKNNPGRDIRKNKRFTKPELSWMFYDWANSVYATNIMAAVFPIYFSSIAAKQGVSGDQLWGFGSSLATLIIAVCAPILGAIGDYKGMKKKLLVTFMSLGVISTTLMAVFDI